jgi:hypothetical protein
MQQCTKVILQKNMVNECTFWHKTGLMLGANPTQYIRNQGETQIQTVEVTMFITATGAGKDRSRKQGVDNPEYRGKGTGWLSRQEGSETG